MQQTGKTVRIDPETMEELEKRGKPFESVNDCVKRILHDDRCAGSNLNQDEEPKEEEKS